MRYLPRLLTIALVVMLAGVIPATAAAAQPVAHRSSYVPKWPQDYADAPCSKSNLNWWIKHVVYSPYDYSFYQNQAFCALPIEMVCLAQQYNKAGNKHVPFYTNRTFYIRCQQAYRHIRALRRARPAHWSACDIIGWASVIAGPFLPVESLTAKGAVVVFGAALKLRCG